MPLKDGKPTLHEQIVAAMCAADPEFESAYTHYMAGEVDDEESPERPQEDTDSPHPDTPATS